jgi:transcriptional regulator with XRE-family HTH domain
MTTPPDPADDRDPRDDQLHALGAFIRAQRQLANLSLRQMSDLAHVSNPYLSQLERGLHEPSVRVLQSISRALNVSADTLLAHAGLAEDGHDDPAVDTEAAIRADSRLHDDQKQALLSVYRSYLQVNEAQG